MIPVMMRFWMPHGGEVTPPGDEYECENPSLIATFNTDGAIDGTSLELSPESAWTYSSDSATASDGSVSPANFSASGGNSASLFSAYMAGNRASGETLRFEFSGAQENEQIAIELADGTDGCKFEYIYNDIFTEPPDPETVSATFTLASGSFAVYLLPAENDEMFLYVAPDFDTEVAILIKDRYSLPNYLPCWSFEVTCSGNNSSVDYIRMCEYSEG